MIANTYINPINGFLAEGAEIADGRVIFDLLLINGIKPNRFVVADIKNSKMVFSL